MELFVTFFFFQPRSPSVRAIILAGVTINVKTTFQESHVSYGSEMVHCCGFSICVSGCHEASVEKILGTNTLF